MTISVLFVCLGNICRSPTAEVVFRQQVKAAGLDGLIAIDSCGTGDWHIGRAPDPRTQDAARQRGYDMSTLRARQLTPADFYKFDLLLAMDDANLADLHAMQPADADATVCHFLDFADNRQEREVPDPYYGGDQGFGDVLDLVEDGARGLLAALRERL